MDRNEYHKLHCTCPNCHSDNLEETLVGPVCLVDDYEDKINTARCQNCGWIGKVHDLATQIGDGIFVDVEGYVVMYHNRFWGINYKDGCCTIYGWVDIDRAQINDLFNKDPAYYTHQDSNYIDEMRKGTVVKIKKIISYELLAKEV